MKKCFEILLVTIMLVTLAACKEKIVVPDFSNSTQEEVLDWCKSLETNPCSFEVDYSDTVEKDYVIYQSIAANDILDDSNISFIISLGKKVEFDTPEVTASTTRQIVETWAKTNKILNKIEYIEEYNDNYDKDRIIKIEPKTVHSYEETIKVYVSLGKKEVKPNPDKEIEVEYEKYLGISESSFREKAKDLGLSPNHNEDRDDYSDDIEKGKIVWHGSGTYVLNETINYGLSLGSSDENIVIKKDQFLGKTLDEFIDAVEDLGLVAKHSEIHEDEKSKYDKNCIIWHGSGTYEKGEVIHYSVSLGKDSQETSDTLTISDKYKYQGYSLVDFTKAVSDYDLKPTHRSDWDEYSNTVEKGKLIRNGFGTYEKGENISYGLSLGKKDGEEVSDTLVLTEADKYKYQGYTLDEFTKAVSDYNLKPNHRSDWDEYSNTVEKGKLIRNGYGTYDKGDNISYGLSLGKKDDNKTVDVRTGQYVGKDESSFKSTISGLKLSPVHDSSKDSYSDSIDSGLVIWHDSGTFNENADLKYGLSKGKEPEQTVTVLGFEDICSGYERSSYEETKASLENYFINTCGFSSSNVSFSGVSSTYSKGVIVSISINGNPLYSSANYVKSSTIVVEICNNQLN